IAILRQGGQRPRQNVILHGLAGQRGHRFQALMLLRGQFDGKTAHKEGLLATTALSSQYTKWGKCTIMYISPLRSSYVSDFHLRYRETVCLWTFRKMPICHLATATTFQTSLGWSPCT